MWTIYTWPELWDGEKFRHYRYSAASLLTGFPPYKSYFIFLLHDPFFFLGNWGPFQNEVQTFQVPGMTEEQSPAVRD